MTTIQREIKFWNWLAPPERLAGGYLPDGRFHQYGMPQHKAGDHSHCHRYIFQVNRATIRRNYNTREGSLRKSTCADYQQVWIHWPNALTNAKLCRPVLTKKQKILDIAVKHLPLFGTYGFNT